jgi:4-hydroxybutyrate CoA-transferase
MSEMSETYIRIAEFIVEMIPDGATIQLGLGDIANAVGYLLESKKDLGAHTEMITNSMMNLINKGVLNSSRKNHRPGKIVYGFGFGSKDLYNFMDRNIMLEAMPISMVNDPRTIAMNDNIISVNNALMIDLTGQVASESLGHEMYSGTGGQLDFVRGAKMSEGGKSIFAIESTAKTKNGFISKITTTFPAGTIVTTHELSSICSNGIWCC